MAGLDIVLFLLIYLWWVVPLIAVIIIVVVLATIRRIVNKVAYIRGGRTIEYKSAQIIGTNIRFKPNIKQKPITLPIVSDPYINYGGLVAKRIFIVVEGSGQTSKFPDGVNALLGVAGKALQEDKIKKANGDILLERRIIQHVPATGAQNPQLTVASASMSLFEHAMGVLSATLPKGKGDILLTVIVGLIMFFGGLAWGHLLFAGH